jgi:hypothetical protein
MGKDNRPTTATSAKSAKTAISIKSASRPSSDNARRPKTSNSVTTSSDLSIISSGSDESGLSFGIDKQSELKTTQNVGSPAGAIGKSTSSDDRFDDHIIISVDRERAEAEERYMIRLLSRRAFHLPNHNWGQDWVQYMKNNHQLFGICFHHELHPLNIPNRLYLLLASTAFGLAVTNCVYLYYAFTDDEMDKLLINIIIDDQSPLNFQNIEALEITYGMVTLWTVGGLLHTLFDICMWYLSACACFLSGASCSRNGKYKLVGSYIVVAIAAVLVALALFVVLLRAAYDRRLRLAQEGIVLEDFEWDELSRIRNFSFLLGYLIELSLVYFAYYPILISLGFFGCIPFLGRTKEIQKQAREREAMDWVPKDHVQNGESA